jgi:hypothetical protein
LHRSPAEYLDRQADRRPLWQHLSLWRAACCDDAPLTMTPEPTSPDYAIEELSAGYRFGIVLALLFATFVFMAAEPSGSVVRVVTVALQGVTLLAALVAAQSHRRLIRATMIVVILAFVAAVASSFVDSSRTGDGIFFVLNALLVAGAPIVIIHSVVRRRTVDIHTVLDAVCVYVLLGMLAAFVFASIGYFGAHPFFAQTKHATISDYLYFSFVTITTTGYGDLTAAGNLGRTIAAFEALVGQLYLVTVLALLISNMAPRRRRNSESEGR